MTHLINIMSQQIDINRLIKQYSMENIGKLSRALIRCGRKKINEMEFYKKFTYSNFDSSTCFRATFAGCIDPYCGRDELKNLLYHLIVSIRIDQNKFAKEIENIDTLLLDYIETMLVVLD
jgi:hypothetical protein